MKILIVDDEKLASSRIKRLLENENIDDITVLNHPQEALKEVSKTKFDMVFLDIAMPEISGLELAKFCNMNQLPILYIKPLMMNMPLKHFKKGEWDIYLNLLSQKIFKQLCKKRDISLIKTNQRIKKF